MKNVAARYLLILACVLSLGKLSIVPEAYGLNLKARFTHPVSAQLARGRERKVKPKKGVDKASPFVYVDRMSIGVEAVEDESDTIFRTVGWVANRLAVSPRTVHQWIRTGTLRAIRLPNRAGYRITDAELRAYLDRAQT